MGNIAISPPIEPVVYGRVCELQFKNPGGLGPIAFRTTFLSEDVLSYLLEDPMLQLSEQQLRAQHEAHNLADTDELFVQLQDPQLAFTKNIDHPGVPNHIYFEGCFHALPTPNPVLSIHPRFGINYHKPAAPVRIRAFVIGLKRANTKWIQEIHARLPKTSRFRKLIEDDKLLADLSIQIHSGEQISVNHMGWHVDACNSLLHMGVSIKGQRTVWAKTSPTTDKTQLHTLPHPQIPSQVYISSPFAFEHAVQYVQADTWDDRMIAIQCRFLMKQEEVSGFFTEDIAAVLRVVSDVLCRANLALPSLAQLQQVEHELAQQQQT
eukprot:c13633_g1_i1.p1 GENE.c13633_g1_i1~~c13633_g1_i1.p1  ORF type:complete len:334 (+),score=86.14 c13633_g1_i1:39-1004(+)